MDFDPGATASFCASEMLAVLSIITLVADLALKRHSKAEGSSAAFCTGSFVCFEEKAKGPRKYLDRENCYISKNAPVIARTGNIFSAANTCCIIHGVYKK